MDPQKVFVFLIMIIMFIWAFYPIKGKKNDG